jgi:hypothetical protein
MTPVRYHEAAEGELLNEIGYLELRAQGLGGDFSPRRDVRKVKLHQDPDVAAELDLLEGTVGDYVGRVADEFATLLRSYGVSDALIAEALRSGYSLWKNILRSDTSAPITCVWDTFYGRKEISALLDVGEFARYLAASAKERCDQRLQK